MGALWCSCAKMCEAMNYHLGGEWGWPQHSCIRWGSHKKGRFGVFLDHGGFSGALVLMAFLCSFESDCIQLVCEKFTVIHFNNISMETMFIHLS